MTDIQLVWLNAMIERENKIEKKERERAERQAKSKGRRGRLMRSTKIP